MTAMERITPTDAASLVDTERGTVSRRLYVDEDLFELEMERIFTRTWVFIGLESEIPEPGDYVTRNMGTDPVIMVRDNDGKIGVFHNSCPHRGVMICQADQGHVKGFVCAYHGWSYHLDGSHAGAFHPEEFYRGGVPFDELGLHKVAQIDTYAGLVFATWNKELGPLIETITESSRWYLDLLLGRTPEGMEVLGPPQRWTAEQNWKIGGINFCGDGPHAPTLHSVIGPQIGESTEQFMAAMLGESPDVTISSGQNMLLNLLPGKETPFIGYPPDLVKLFKETLNAEQINLLGRMMTNVCTLFPHLSLVQAPVRFSENEPPVNFLTLRVWQPVSATRTEVWNWFLVEKEASEEYKEAALKAGLRSFSAGGTFDQDDAEGWSATSRGLQGPIGRSLNLSFQTVVGWRDEVWEDFPGPGKTSPNMYTEMTEFEYLTEWKRWMGGEK